MWCSVTVCSFGVVVFFVVVVCVFFLQVDWSIFFFSLPLQSEIQFCVLDEADLMLQMGFQEPVEEIFKEMPDNKQTTLWSATMPRESCPCRHLRHSTCIPSAVLVVVAVFA